MNHARITLICLSVFLCLACTSPAKKQSTTMESESTKSVPQQLPPFSGDSAWLYAKAQTVYGPRIPNSAAHNACKNYLVATLKRFGATVSEQSFTVRAWDGKELYATNIIASLFPERKERVMLCAHWDSRPWADQDPNPTNHKKPILGANDGASGVGVLMEIARILGNKQLTTRPSVGIDLVLFDVEDYGTPSWFEGEKREDSWCLGSQYWSRQASASGYKARFGILLDMVGDEKATFYWESYSLGNAPLVVNKVWNAATSLGYGNLFLSREGGFITDDHLPVIQLAGIRCIDIIDFDPTRPTGFPAYWHTMGDTMENLSATTLKAVGETLIKVVYSE